MIYQLGWTTLPGLRGLSCSEFRACPTESPDNQAGSVVNVTVQYTVMDIIPLWSSSQLALSSTSKMIISQ